VIADLMSRPAPGPDQLIPAPFSIGSRDKKNRLEMGRGQLPENGLVARLGTQADVVILTNPPSGRYLG
jgi:hypothetical protein